MEASVCRLLPLPPARSVKFDILERGKLGEKTEEVVGLFLRERQNQRKQTGRRMKRHTESTFPFENATDSFLTERSSGRTGGTSMENAKLSFRVPLVVLTNAAQSRRRESPVKQSGVFPVQSMRLTSLKWRSGRR